VLKTAGFKTALSMEGGIHAWQGLKAAGELEAGTAFFPDKAGYAELIALAWVLEDGSEKFYASVAGIFTDNEAARLFTDLAGAEEHHKATLIGLYRDVTGTEPQTGFPRGIIEYEEGLMEGGVKLGEALAWVKDRDVRQSLELSMALETDAYDLYIKMGRRVSGDKAKQVFDLLIQEEKEHLARMAALLDKNL
jgi:sulfur-carrier protein adenylyltransferase/sulfurtransferase